MKETFLHVLPKMLMMRQGEQKLPFKTSKFLKILPATSFKDPIKPRF
jgi:hypothetical protein